MSQPKHNYKYSSQENRILDHIDIDQLTGCWEWNRGGLVFGYGYTYYRAQKWRAHRLSWHIFNGQIPEGILVLHKCDNRSCCNPDHLFLGTHRDNVQDMLDKGRGNFVHGENHYLAKLNDADIPAIHEMIARGVPQKDIAKLKGVSKTTISEIHHGKVWAHFHPSTQKVGP